jgi:hypothetical protein
VKRFQRAYSDEDIADALATVKSLDGNLTAAAEQTGIPRQTLDDWAKGRTFRCTSAGVTATRRKKEKDLGAKCEKLAWKLADSMSEKIAGANLASAATSFGIFVDKMRLLREESTVITDTRTEVAQLVMALAQKYDKSPEEVQRDLIRIRPDMAQYLESPHSSGYGATYREPTGRGAQ